MATKQVFATRDFKYGTRMMRAGDPVEMTAPHQRLYRALGAISATRPRKAPEPTVETQSAAEQPAKPKRKATRRKKTA